MLRIEEHGEVVRGFKPSDFLVKLSQSLFSFVSCPAMHIGLHIFSSVPFQLITVEDDGSHI